MAIVDERIFKFCKEKEMVRRRLHEGGIIVPHSIHFEDKVFNMNDLKIYNANQNIENKVGFSKYIHNKTKSPEELRAMKPRQLYFIKELDVLIIHQGILDKLFPSRYINGSSSYSSIDGSGRIYQKLQIANTLCGCYFR